MHQMWSLLKEIKHQAASVAPAPSAASSSLSAPLSSEFHAYGNMNQRTVPPALAAIDTTSSIPQSVQNFSTIEKMFESTLAKKGRKSGNDQQGHLRALTRTGGMLEKTGTLMV